METISSPLRHPLATEKIGRLILKFAIPATISFLVSALYNIVDQIFIGQGVGLLGNAATNVAFPLTTISTALALLLGVGSASNFNLNMGAGKKEEAAQIAGTGIFLMAVCGVVLCALVVLFLRPLIWAFGATEQVYGYATTYTGITSLGIPFIIFSTGGSQLVRADGCPTYSMVCMLSGAVINTILDPLFIFTFQMGIAGAALATVLGQMVSGILVLIHFLRFKSVRLKKTCFRPHRSVVRAIVSLGAAACFNQLAMCAVQITMNNTLTYYGSLSSYGSDIPLACVGVISKVNIVLMAFILGISQGCQPINGFNYGARQFGRVKRTYFTGAAVVTIISAVAFLGFQLFPRQIVGIFGGGSEEYFHFAERYLRIFMLMTFVNGIQPLTSNFFTSIGKARVGIMLSLTRQIIFLLPLVLLFPAFLGIDGVMYAGPIADTAAAVLAFFFVAREMKRMGRNECPTP